MWIDYFQYEYCIADDLLFIKGYAENEMDQRPGAGAECNRVVWLFSSSGRLVSVNKKAEQAVKQNAGHRQERAPRFMEKMTRNEQLGPARKRSAFGRGLCCT